MTKDLKHLKTFKFHVTIFPYNDALSGSEVPIAA